MSELHGTGGFWNRVRDFFRMTLDADTAPESQSPPPSRIDPLSQLLAPLDQLRHGAIVKVDEKSEPSRADSIEDPSRPVRAIMRAEILELHRKLGTGFTVQQLEETSAALKAHCQAFRAPRPDELTELAMLAVMARLHREALEWAWTEFERLLETVDLRWPEPEGLSPRADAEQVERHRQLHRKGLREAFVGGSFARLADLLLGEVPAWGGLYPTPHGSVWQETVYEAVAAALACRRLARLESLAEREHALLERLMAEALSEPMARVREALSKGVRSASEARRLSDEAVLICQRIAPAVVWEHLKQLPLD